MQTTTSSRPRIIHFTSRGKEVDGFYKLLRARMPIKSAGEHKYIIGKEHCTFLNKNGIKNNVDYIVEKYL